MTVQNVRVGDVLRLERRPVQIDPESQYEEIGIRSFGRGIFHKEPLSGAELGTKRVFSIEPGDLVISNVFAWEGAIAVASAAEAGKIGSHRFMTFVPVGDQIETAWAAWFFRSEAGLELIRMASPGSAGRNRTLAIDRFEALEIPLPSLSEQRQATRYLHTIATTKQTVKCLRTKAEALASVLPLAVAAQMEREAPLSRRRLGDELTLVRDSLTVDPLAPYVSIGVRSFGRGIFHYPCRPGAEIGKLRFQVVFPRLLAVSNIKAWEGAIATTEDIDVGAVASNRFLLFRPVAGEDATDYFWALLLRPDGLRAMGQASPGSADRNRTLAMDRFNQIQLSLPSRETQAEIGRRVRAARLSVGDLEAATAASNQRVESFVPAALNEFCTSLK